MTQNFGTVMSLELTRDDMLHDMDLQASMNGGMNQSLAKKDIMVDLALQNNKFSSHRNDCESTQQTHNSYWASASYDDR